MLKDVNHVTSHLVILLKEREREREREREQHPYCDLMNDVTIEYGEMCELKG